MCKQAKIILDTLVTTDPVDWRTINLRYFETETDVDVQQNPQGLHFICVCT